MRLVPPLFLRLSIRLTILTVFQFSKEHVELLTFNLHAFREDEMIWQDPVDYSHITYEYDHR